MTNITVMIPTYNRAVPLARALESLTWQTDSDFLVVIVDNCSDDGTESVVEVYREKLNITYFRADRNFGPIANWEMGLKAVKTEWVKILWSDDWLEATAIEELRRFRDEYSLDVVLCGAFMHFEEKKINVHERFEGEYWPQLVSRLIEGSVPVSATAGLLRTKDAAEGLSNRFLDPLAYKTAIGPDLILLYWPAIKGGTVGYLDLPLVNMYASEDSISVLRQNQLGPLYAHAILSACHYSHLTLMPKDKKILDHWIKAGMLRRRIPKLINTPGKYSILMGVTAVFARLRRRLHSWVAR